MNGNGTPGIEGEDNRTTAVLTTRDLLVRYGRRTALSGVDLTIEDRGHVVGVFGQNGAGKSTLLRVISGIINRFDGQLTASSPTIAYLPDRSFLHPWLTLSTCIRLAARLWDDFDAATAGAIFRHLKLPLDLRIRQASKGMAEQIHLGLVLARRSGLYVFDEPLAAVDPLTRDRLIEMIRQYRAPDSTVILSTHLISGLESLFDEAVVVHDGRVVLHEQTAVLQPGELEARVKEVIAADALAR